MEQPPPRLQGQVDPGASTTMLTETSAPTYFLPAVYWEMGMALSKRLRLVPGFRVDYNSATEHADTSPRISGRYDLIPGENRTSIKGGVGIFHQPPQPLEVSSVFGTPGLRSNRAVHYAIGLEQLIDRRFEFSLEGFYKSLDNLVARTPTERGGEGYTNLGTGYVVGSEVLLRYKADERFFGWVAYTLSRSTRRQWPEGPLRLFNYDQTHILTILGSYRLGGGWELGARFRFVSGNPYTACNAGVLNGSTGSYGCLAGQSQGDRLPPFHSLDVRIDKHWYWDDYQLSMYLDVYNAYGRQNPENVAYNFDYSQRLYQIGLPIIPSIGFRGEF
jgi:hypothetical protein